MHGEPLADDSLRNVLPITNILHGRRNYRSSTIMSRTDQAPCCYYFPGHAQDPVPRRAEVKTSTRDLVIRKTSLPSHDSSINNFGAEFTSPYFCISKDAAYHPHLALPLSRIFDSLYKSTKIGNEWVS